MAFRDLAAGIADDFAAAAGHVDQGRQLGGGFYFYRRAVLPSACVHCAAPLEQAHTGRPRFICPALRCQRAQRAFIERRRVQRLRAALEAQWRRRR